MSSLPRTSWHLLLLVIGSLFCGALLLWSGFHLLKKSEKSVGELLVPHGEEHRVAFGGNVTVSQTFTPSTTHLSRIDLAIDLPTSPSAFPLFVHLRSSPNDSKDLRTFAIRDADISVQHYRSIGTQTIPLVFLRLSTPEDKPLSIVLSAPGAKDTDFGVWREEDQSKYPDGELRIAGKIVPGNIGVKLYERTSPLEQWLSRPFIQLKELRNIPFAPLAVGLVVVSFLSQKRIYGWLSLPTYTLGRSGRIFLFGCFILSLLLHQSYIHAYPIVNDEGSYLMDIQNMIQGGAIPFHDFLTKGPFFLVLLTPIVFFGGHSVFPARYAMATAGGMEAVLLGIVATRLWGRRAGLTAGLLYATLPLAIAQSTQIFLQPFQLIIVTCALLFLIPSRPETRIAGGRALLSGSILALAYLTRASSLAFLPPFCLLLLGVPKATWKHRLLFCTFFVIGFFGILLVAWGILLPFLGFERTSVLFNIEALTIGANRAAIGQSTFGAIGIISPKSFLEILLNYGSFVITAGLPVIGLWIVAVCIALVSLLRLPRSIGFIAALGILYSAFGTIHQTITTTHNASITTLSLQLLLGFVAIAVFSLGSMWTDGRKKTFSERWYTSILLVGTWASLVVLYVQYGRFRQHYHAEFIPFYVLGAAWMISQWRGFTYPKQESLNRWLIRGSQYTFAFASAVLAFWLTGGHDIIERNPHVGTLNIQDTIEFSQLVQAATSPNEIIFTAQPAITFLANRPIIFHASHPGWYLEERKGTIPSSLRALFFPDPKDTYDYIESHPIQTIVTETRTKEVYLDADPRIATLLSTKFQLIAERATRSSTTLQLWERKPVVRPSPPATPSL